LNSIATPAETTIDWLRDGEGLLRWLAQARLVPQETLDGIAAQALPDELESLAGQARSLREWFRSFVVKHVGRPLTGRELGQLAPLNRLLARDELFSQVVRSRNESRLVVEAMRRWRSPEALLLPIAEALARFVSDESFANIKACERAGCTLFFADRTRGHTRRWCSMALCGNRVKQAAHRHRNKSQR
jgi:predicted RNA-binding Zn ribbon-like protein